MDNRTVTVTLPGYAVIEQTSPKIVAGGKTIVWCEEKAWNGAPIFKCEGDSPGGFPCEGTGPTLDDALEDLYIWFDSMDAAAATIKRA